MPPLYAPTLCSYAIPTPRPLLSIRYAPTRSLPHAQYRPILPVHRAATDIPHRPIPTIRYAATHSLRHVQYRPMLTLRYGATRPTLRSQPTQTLLAKSTPSPANSLVYNPPPPQKKGGVPRGGGVMDVIATRVVMNVTGDVTVTRDVTGDVTGDVTRGAGDASKDMAVLADIRKKFAELEMAPVCRARNGAG
eukprot:3084399-Rhodomonas_salina.1